MRPSLGILLLLWQSVLGAQPQVEISIKNDSGLKLHLNWVNPGTGEAAAFAVLEKDQNFGAQSFLGHEFEVREMPSEDSGVCESSEDQTCKINRFKITVKDEQNFVVRPGLEVEIKEKGQIDEQLEDKSSAGSKSERLEPVKLMAICRANARESLDRAKDNPETEKHIMEGFNACLKSSIFRTLKQKEEEIQFHTVIRDTASDGMENFTCADTNLETSPDIDQRKWTSENDGVTRAVHVKFDRPTSRIHLVENFASPEECDAMEETAAQKLQHASVADGKGGTRQSEARKAMQAGIFPAWDKEKDGDLVTRLSRRVYDYTNHVLGLNITEHGQEPMMSIQYFGRGYDDIEPDRYSPHCDSGCVGEPHQPGSRMATMVIYCAVPERGGHTNFKIANVHVKPEAGSALFFSYIDPKTNITDKAMTTHSGCPVYEGEKKIITQWVRFGVDSKTTHNSFNTMGILRTEAGE